MDRLHNLAVGRDVPEAIETRILLLCLAAVVIAEGVFSLVSYAAAVPCSLIVLAAARALEIVLLFGIVSIWGRGMASMGLAQHQIVPGLKKGLIWSAGFGLLSLLGGVLLHVAGVNPFGLIKARLPTGLRKTVLFFVVAGAVAPVAEEIFFRGILYGFLRRWGVFVALVGSTAAFVLAHAVQTGIPFTQIVGGVLFAVAYEATKNLMVPITIHVLGNSAIFVLSMIS